MKKLPILIVAICIFPAFLRAQNKQVIINKLNSERNPLKRFVLLDSLACCYLMDGNQDTLAFETSEEQIQLARKYSPELELQALLQSGIRWYYYVGNKPKTRYEQSCDYLTELLEKAKEEKNQIYECEAMTQLVCLGSYYGNDFPYTHYAVESEKLASLMSNDSLKILAKLAAGRAFFFKNSYTDAYNKYFEAADIANELNDSTFRRLCYMRFADLYNELKMYPEAIQNLRLALKIDSSKKYFNKRNIIEDYNWIAMVHSNIPKVGPNMARRDDEILIDFCSSPVNNIYPTWAKSVKVGVYECYIKCKHFKTANDYRIKNPDVDTILKLFDQKYRSDVGQALACYEDGKYPQADSLTRIAISELKNKEPQLLLSADLIMDSVLIKENKNKAADSYLHKALQIAKDHNIVTEEIAGVYGMLSKAYAQQKNYRSAYYYLNEKQKYNDRVNTDRNTNQFILSSLQKEKESLMNARKRKEEKKEDKKQLLYIGIAFIVVVLFASAAYLSATSGKKELVRLCIVLSFLLAFEAISNVIDGVLGESINDNPIYSFAIKAVIGILLGVVHNRTEKYFIGKLNAQEIEQQSAKIIHS